MLRIMIVDDEPKFRDYLRQVIDWADYGFTICGEARNGIEALVVASETIPDIALLDINMPLMDGIGLTEKLKANNHEIAVVFITGHSEFEYARKALKLGVDDYLLKPFKKDELVSTLLKVKLKLEKMLEEKVQAKVDASFLRERFLNMMIGEEYDIGDEETVKILQRLGIVLQSGYFVVIAVEIDNMYQLWTAAGDIIHWKAVVSNCLSEIIKPTGTQLIFNGPGGRIISIVNFISELEKNNFVVEPYYDFCHFIKRHFNFTVTVGIGRPVFGFQAIRKSYTEAVITLLNKLMEENGKVIEYAALINGNRKTGFYRIDLNDKILKALRMNDMDEVKNELRQVLEYIKENRLFIDYTNTIMMGLVSICLSYITEVGGSIENILGNDFSPSAAIKNNNSLDASFDWLVAIFTKTAENSSENRMTRARRIIDSVKDYIHKNYQDNELSVEKIAHNIYLDSSYIRKVFAKELEITVIDYITNVRMQKAMEILRSGNIKLSEISEMVGYNDAGYFSKCFKKQFGISPSEYHS